MRMMIALLAWSLAFAVQAIEADRLVLDAATGLSSLQSPSSASSTRRSSSFRREDSAMLLEISRCSVVRRARAAAIWSLLIPSAMHRNESCAPALSSGSNSVGLRAASCVK